MTSPPSSNPASRGQDQTSGAKKRAWLPIASLVLALVGGSTGALSLQLAVDALGNPCGRTSTPDLTLPVYLFLSSMAIIGIATYMGSVAIGNKIWYPPGTVPRGLAILGVVLGIPGMCGLLALGTLVLLGGNLCG